MAYDLNRNLKLNRDQNLKLNRKQNSPNVLQSLGGSGRVRVDGGSGRVREGWEGLGGSRRVREGLSGSGIDVGSEG